MLDAGRTSSDNSAAAATMSSQSNRPSTSNVVAIHSVSVNSSSTVVSSTGLLPQPVHQQQQQQQQLPLTTAPAIRQRLVDLVPRLTHTHKREDSQSQPHLSASMASAAAMALMGVHLSGDTHHHHDNANQEHRQGLSVAMATLLASCVAAAEISPVTVRLIVDMYLQQQQQRQQQLQPQAGGQALRQHTSPYKQKNSFSLLAQDSSAAMRLYRQSDDPMDLPVCSHEWSVLVRLLVWLSKRGNRRYQLPQDARYLRMSWAQLWEMKRLASYMQRRLRFHERQLASASGTAAASRTSTMLDTPSHGKNHTADTAAASAASAATDHDRDIVEDESAMLRTWLTDVLPPATLLGLYQHVFRINLRTLASYRVFGTLLLCVLFVGARYRMWSDVWASVVAVPLLWLIVRGSFPEYIIR